jgi:MSHA biogenesis protein MshQ
MLHAAVAGLARPVAVALLLALTALLPAHAATYTFRSDTYSWESTANTITTWDNTCTGYPVDDDKVTLNFSGGFTFTFAGTAYSSVRVLSNGMLQFGTDDGFHRTYINTTLPAAAPGNYGVGCANATPTNVLMGYWMDLKPYSTINSGGGGTVSWEQKGTAPNRYFVVSWNSVYQYNTTTPFTFQIILYENGEFKYQYNNANASGSTATIGVQVSSSDYTLYSYKSGYNGAGTAIRWFVASGTPNRVATYRFDEQSYTGALGEIIDSSGNNHSGTAVGGIQTTANGYVCRALDVPSNTKNNVITAADTQVDVSSALGSAGSISMWVRSNVVWTNNTAATLADATTVANRPFYLMRSGGGALKFAVSDSNGTILSVSSSTQNFAANTWVHVAATWNLTSGSNGSVLRIYVNGQQVGAVTGTTTGTVDPSVGTLYIGDNRTSGVTPSGGTGNSANGAIDELNLYNYEISAVELAADMSVSHGCSQLDHVEIHGSATGLTCTPSTFTVVACQNSSCSSTYTGGLTGTMTPSGSNINWSNGGSFSIPSGSSQVDVTLQVTTPSSVSLSVNNLSATTSNLTSCNFGSPSCTYTSSDSALLISVPDHYADSTQTVTVSAVKKGDTSPTGVCVPAFKSVSKTLNFSCSYGNPTSGTLPVRVGGVALNAAGSAAAACDASGKGVTLSFDATGSATTTLQYADVGLMTLKASYTGSGSDAGLSMTGTDNFTAAPTSFSWSNLPAAKVAAGSTFSATVTALNSSGNATPNFGLETSPQQPTIGKTIAAPTGSVSAGTFNTGTVGSFSNGAANVTGMSWTEVGRLDLTASLANYLSANPALPASGSTSGGPVVVIPHHFDVSLAAAGCSNTGAGHSSFTYAGLGTVAGQGFQVDVTARNASGATTTNYDGSLGSPVSRAVTLSESSALGGTLNVTTAITAASFRAGSTAGGTHGTANYAFTSKTTAPGTLVVRAVDTDGVTSANGSPVTEAQVPLRSGRLRLFNAFGSGSSSLSVPMQAEYWNGSAWVLNSDDICTNVTSASVALSNVRSGTGSAGAWTTTATPSGALASGYGKLTLSAPSPAGNTGTVDVGLNLGSTSTDQACTTSHPSTTGAALAWLRAQNGSCASTWDRDPSARASFGIYSPETKKTVHVRELF